MEGGQMNSTTRTVLAILAFIALSLGTFIWYIATWDPSKNESLTQRAQPYLLAINIPGDAENSANFLRGAAPLTPSPYSSERLI